MTTPEIPALNTKREPFVVEVTGHLIDYLLSRRIAPGSRLPSERQLAESIGVGRSVVREALSSLNLLGLVEKRPGSGHFVTDGKSELLPKVIQWGLLLGEKQVEDLIEAREHIEVIIARLAAEHRTDDDLEQLRRHLDVMESASTMEDFRDADVAFHLTLAGASGNAVFREILRNLQSLLRVWISRVLDQAGYEGFQVLYEQHRAIFQAVRNQDADRAVESMRGHMDQVYAELMRSFGGHLKKPGFESSEYQADKRHPIEPAPSSDKAARPMSSPTASSVASPRMEQN